MKSIVGEETEWEVVECSTGKEKEAEEEVGDTSWTYIVLGVDASD